MRVCSNCNQSNIKQHVKIGMSAEAGGIGPQFKKGFLRGNEPLFCDVCLDCGEVLRFYIKNTKRNFIEG